MSCAAPGVWAQPPPGGDGAHKEILLETGLRGFVETSDEEYNVVRALLTSIRMPY